jgi:NADP-dependent 3-hydroxy acid dehydrogenase YdfG
MSNNIPGKVVVITRASSGLGEAAARELARHGAKHAVRVISDGLRQEVKPYNIQTTMISPGAVASEPPNTITDPDIAERMRKV